MQMTSEQERIPCRFFLSWLLSLRQQSQWRHSPSFSDEEIHFRPGYAIQVI